MQCWNPSRGQMPADLSPQSLTTNPPLTHPTSSELSCFAACGSPFLCLPASAGAVALLTYLATTVPLAHRQGFFAVEGWHSSGLQPGSAEKQGQGSQPTPGWQTSTWHKSPVKMTDASKSLPLAFKPLGRSSTGHRHHPCLPFDTGRAASPPCRHLRRGSSPYSPPE